MSRLWRRSGYILRILVAPKGLALPQAGLSPDRAVRTTVAKTISRVGRPMASSLCRVSVEQAAQGKRVVDVENLDARIVVAEGGIGNVAKGQAQARAVV